MADHDAPNDPGGPGPLTPVQIAALSVVGLAVLGGLVAIFTGHGDVSQVQDLAAWALGALRGD